MAKAEPVGYICFDKENMSEEDKELAELYWQINEENPKKFVYTINEFNEKFGISMRRVTVVVQRHYGFSFCSSQYCCDICKVREVVSDRVAYKNLFKEKNVRCSKCIEKVAIEKEQFRYEQVQKFKEEYLFSNYHINDFSFIEKIFVLTFLSNNDHLSFGDHFSLPRIHSITDNQGIDNEIISALVDKKIIFDSAEYSGDLDIFSILDANHYQYNFFLFKTSDEYLDKNALITSLYESITSLEVNKKDLEEMNGIIESVRLMNIYRLSNYWANYFSIEIKLTTKIDSTFRYMARKFTLMQCAQIIFNQSKNAAANANRKPKKVNYYAQKNSFAWYLEGYLGRVEINGWTVYSSYTLPESIDNSLFESMVCELFMHEKRNWHEMTTKEIMEEWVSSLKVIKD